MLPCPVQASVLVDQPVTESGDNGHPATRMPVRQQLRGRAVKEAQVLGRHDGLADGRPGQVAACVGASTLIPNSDRAVVEKGHLAARASGTERSSFIGHVGEHLVQQMERSAWRVEIGRASDRREVRMIDRC